MKEKVVGLVCLSVVILAVLFSVNTPIVKAANSEGEEMVALRPTLENAGWLIEWHAEENRVEVSRNGISYLFTPEKDIVICLNDGTIVAQRMTGIVTIKDGTTYVPLEFVNQEGML